MRNTINFNTEEILEKLSTDELIFEFTIFYGKQGIGTKKLKEFVKFYQKEQNILISIKLATKLFYFNSELFTNMFKIRLSSSLKSISKLLLLADSVNSL